jgi:hypothetical protein
MTSKEGCGLEMFTRVATAATMIAIVLCGSSQSLDAQSSPTLALVDVPIPIYPPIAAYAAISGDVARHSRRSTGRHGRFDHCRES